MGTLCSSFSFPAQVHLRKYYAFLSEGQAWILLHGTFNKGAPKIRIMPNFELCREMSETL
jgi:hypothetical protein